MDPRAGNEDSSGRWRPVAPLRESFDAGWIGEAAGGTADDLPSILCRAAARALRMDGAGLCISVDSGMRLPLGASDAHAATAERLQFTAGQGPCFEAMASGRPITVDRDGMQRRWPGLAALHRGQTPYLTGLAIPLRSGADRFGALDLYSMKPARLDGHDVIAAQLIAGALGDVLLTVLDPVARTTAAGRSPVASWWDTENVQLRRGVWIAVGMANATWDVDNDGALAVLRAASVRRGQTLDELAGAVVSGDVLLSDLT